MLNLLTIVLIVLILFFIEIFENKYLFNAFNKNKLYLMQNIHNKNHKNNYSVSKNNHYQNIFYKYSKFYERTLREKC